MLIYLREIEVAFEGQSVERVAVSFEEALKGFIPSDDSDHYWTVCEWDTDTNMVTRIWHYDKPTQTWVEKFPERINNQQPE